MSALESKTPTYPLADHAEDLRAASGRALADLTVAAAAEGAQAEIARAAGYGQLAANLTRAAELTAVPNAEVLRMYDMLRPGRASQAELAQLADTLEHTYAAPTCAALVREAAEVYRQRGLARRTSTGR